MNDKPTKINENTYINLATLVLLMGVAWYLSGMATDLRNVALKVDDLKDIPARVSALENKDNLCHICKTNEELKNLDTNIFLPNN